MFSKATNSKKQGDIGLGSAISYFTTQGLTVSLPLTDSQDYDLVVDIDDSLKRVQIKTTASRAPSGFYIATLKVCGGNKSSSSVKHFDKTKVEYLYVLTEDGDRYLIPTSEIQVTNSLTLNESLYKFKV